MDRRIEDRIADLARRQHGVVTREQLLDIGLLPGAVRRRVNAGRMSRLHRGVYLVGPIMPPRAREMAAALACGPTAVVSHRTAACLWGLVSPPDDDARLDVSVSYGSERRRDGIRVHRVSRLPPEDRTELTAIPITTPARTLVDFASAANGRELEQALAVAEKERLVTLPELNTVLQRNRGRPGTRLLMAVLQVNGGPALTRSEAEARFLALIRQARLPPPEVNTSIETHELDFFWRAEKIAVEVDGYRYHSSMTRFESDRRRSAHLAARGIQIIPLTWRQIVEDGVATAVQIGQALLHARLR